MTVTDATPNEPAKPDVTAPPGVSEDPSAQGPPMYAGVQWKGTNACVDLWCTCGRHLHFDGWFGYAFACPCGKVWHWPLQVPLAPGPHASGIVHLLSAEDDGLDQDAHVDKPCWRRWGVNSAYRCAATHGHPGGCQYVAIGREDRLDKLGQVPERLTP